MNIEVKSLEAICSLLLNKLKSDGYLNIEVDTDLYQVIWTDDWDNFNEEVKPVVGSLKDDWDSLKLVLQDKERVTYLDFERLSSILRAISEQVSPSR